MQLITKQEAFKLREQGLQNYVKRSKSRHPKYYLVESKKALDALEKYRKSKTVENYNYN